MSSSSLVREFVKEAREFPATMILLGAYVGLFLVTAIAQGRLELAPHPIAFGGLTVNTLIDAGAIEKDRIFNGHEYWRVITATLLHGSVVHLLLNALALWQLGRMIEDWHGGGVLILLHLVLGIAGSLASLWIHRMMPGRLVQVGGSGAIFGLGAFLMVANYFDDHPESPNLCRSLFWYLVIGFGMGMLMGADDAAHLGGALAGAMVGTMDDFLRPNVLPRWVARVLGIVSLSIMAGSFALAARTHADRQAQRVQERLRLEQMQRDRLNLAHRLRAGMELSAVFRYAEWALQEEKPEALKLRVERGALMEHLANQMSHDEVAEVLRSAAAILRLPSDEEFLRRENLEKLAGLRAKLPGG